MIELITSQKALHVREQLNNVANVILAIVALWGFRVLSIWRKQKHMEKKIEWAEESLINLELYVDQITDWFLFAISPHQLDVHGKKFYEIASKLKHAQIRASWIRDTNLDVLFQKLDQLTNAAPRCMQDYSDIDNLVNIKHRQPNQQEDKIRNIAYNYLCDTPGEIIILAEQIAAKLKNIMSLGLR